MQVSSTSADYNLADDLARCVKAMTPAEQRRLQEVLRATLPAYIAEAVKAAKDTAKERKDVQR